MKTAINNRLNSLRSPLAMLLVLLAAGTFTVHAVGFSSTGSMGTARFYHTATLLSDGKVLVVGGGGGAASADAELYDPMTGIWTPTGSLTTARFFHTATLLPNGMVLVVGGYTFFGTTVSSELYDPTTGTWTPTGDLSTARDTHTATLLPNGRVLVVGGAGGDASVDAELYNPTTGTWTPAGSLTTARISHTATLLPNGKVLVVGGDGSIAGAELYDPALDAWTGTGALATGRVDHTATLLTNGLVLVVGGIDSNDHSVASAELYDPALGTWTATGSLTTGRNTHTATVLTNGLVLVAGGYAPGGPTASAEVYNPAAGTWAATGSLFTGRWRHTATLLGSGQVLVAGGDTMLGQTVSAELYVPATSVATAPVTNGLYNGLFSGGSVTKQSAGFIRISVNNKRGYSAVLFLDGDRLTAVGRFDTNGFASNRIVRGGKYALTVSLQALADNTLSGTVACATDGWSSTVSAPKAGFTSLQTTTTYNGSYTMVIPGTSNNPALPAGNGFVRARVSTAGPTRAAGSLGDGQKFVAVMASVSADGKWPLYGSVAGYNGMIMGWVQFTNNASDSQITGNLTWIKTSGTSGYYNAGFTNSPIPILGSVYILRPFTEGLFVKTGVLSLDGGNLGTPLDLALNTPSPLSPRLYNVPAHDGLCSFIKGSIRNPGNTNAVMTFTGVYLQSTNLDFIGGQFLGTNQSGSFLWHRN